MIANVELAFGGRQLAITLQQLFLEHGLSFMRRHHLSHDMVHAIFQIASCRTAALGGHTNRCPDCGHTQIAYNSCMHRCCPQCAWLPRERWLRGWKERLLPVPHHHVVFTVSHLLNDLWRFNKKTFAKVLFQAVSETLIELLADPQYLGARPGLLTALHTWNQKLLPHVHMHVLVTAGGLNDEQQWVSTRKSCLLPRKVLMLKFRGKFLYMLKKGYQDNSIQLPHQWSEQNFESVIRKSRSQDWNVKIHDSYDHAAGVATYLARYIKGGPMGKSRLIDLVDGKVRYRYRISTMEGGDGKKQGVDALPLDTFLLRWLEHVPPRRFQTVRGYGLYGGNQHSQNDEARLSLGLSLPEGVDQRKLRCEELLDQAGYKSLRLCPKCGGELYEDETIQGCRSPPQWLEHIQHAPRPVREHHEAA